MDFFDGPYYRFNKILLIATGQWPFHTNLRRTCIILVIALLAGTHLLAKLAAFFDSINDIDQVLDDLPAIIANMSAIVSLSNSLLQLKKMKKLLNRVEADFISYKNTDEFHVLNEYAKTGRNIALWYSGALTTAMVFYLTLPLKPLLYETFNSTSERPLFHHTKYFVDTDDYYCLVILHSQVTIIIFIAIFVAVDTMFLVYLQHACGLFATIGYQLNSVTKSRTLEMDIYPSLVDDEAYKMICQCVYRHVRAIKFVAYMESYYSINTFLQTGINVIQLSIVGLEALGNIDDTMVFIHFVLLSQGQLIHLFVQCYYAQRLIDRSGEVHRHLGNVEWYQTSIRTRNLIRMMLIRGLTPSVLTGANVFTLSMEMFSTIVRTAMSFFTVLRSTR